MYKTISVMDEIRQIQSVFWVNPKKQTVEEAANQCRYSKVDVDEAEERLKRFAPFLQIVFPETKATNGIIESELTPMPWLKEQMEEVYETSIQGNLYLKRDDTLPIAGTIKARGAIYEVLKHAETIALEAGLLTSTDENYAIFATEPFREFFAKHKIVVGTTGNLGISVGVMSAALGFSVTVHMSMEAKQWKKDYLRGRGVTVVEHETNFTQAVENGRLQAESDPMYYFVDDEHSADLFLGYTVAGNRLKKQLKDKGIVVDAEHPLFVYLPCGIGGSPGGITFGLKQNFGDNVHCFFAEPTKMPSMLLGLVSEKYDGITVEDAGIEPVTVMDGLAVPRTSRFIAEMMEPYFSGGFTVQEDESLYWLATMMDETGIPLEPAALAGVPGSAALFKTESGQSYIEQNHLEPFMPNATHIAWATGGSMVPAKDREAFYRAGKNAQAPRQSFR